MIVVVVAVIIIISGFLLIDLESVGQAIGAQESACGNQFPADGLINYWSFDEGEGNEIRDSAGDNVGKYIGNKNWDGDCISGKCISFDGESYVELDSFGFPYGGKPRTVCSWMRATKIPDRTHAYGFGYGMPNYQSGFSLGAVNEHLVVSGQATSVMVSNFWWANKWSFICATYNGQTVGLYYGINELSYNQQDMWLGTAPGVARMGQGLSGQHSWVGQLDETAVFDRVISKEEVESFFKNKNYCISEFYTGGRCHEGDQAKVFGGITHSCEEVDNQFKWVIQQGQSCVDKEQSCYSKGVCDAGICKGVEGSDCVSECASGYVCSQNKCIQIICGNNQIEGPEICDSLVFRNDVQTCEQIGYAGGTRSCVNCGAVSYQCIAGMGSKCDGDHLCPAGSACVGNLCIPDDDNDNVANEIDNCPLVYNAEQTDVDVDGHGNLCDNCVVIANAGQEDLDEDLVGDVCDLDDDGDTIADTVDNCVNTVNTNQLDTDEDGMGDVCEDDDDGDGILDIADNCPLTSNVGQEDLDWDLVGDVCDNDKDNDGTLDSLDNCPLNVNVGQGDTDNDGLGNACDTDDDGDTVFDEQDNCPLVPNPGQTNTDFDANGDACDDDDDNDGIVDIQDNCPLIIGEQTDTDADLQGDACDDDDDNDGVIDVADNCALVINPIQKDIDNDGIGDNCDNEKDGDGVADAVDNCPIDVNLDQLDNDGDQLGDVCDPDDDNDQKADLIDNCPFAVNVNQFDTDNDGFGDICDSDDDGDNVLDIEDNCALIVNPSQEDFDSDSIGDVCDSDADSDGAIDVEDNCPLIVNPGQEDFDSDGIGDICDDDVDGDKVLNVDDSCMGPLWAEVNDNGCGLAKDSDGDGLFNLQDNCPLVANPGQEDLDGNGIGDACETVEEECVDDTVLISKINDWLGNGLNDAGLIESINLWLAGC